MEYTENLNLKKPAADEPYNIEDFNYNADTMDAAIGGKMDKPSVQTLTIPATSWTATTGGQYAYSNTVSVSGITAADIPQGSITLATESIAQGCNLAAQCESGNGTITFYAQSVPTAEMVYEFYILKGAVS